MQGDGVKISVILRCKNEEQWIGHCLQSIIDHLDDPEVIVIDNLSSDDSMDVVRMFEHHVDINKLDIHDYYPGKSLNIGVNAAKHDYILIISAHCVIIKIDIDQHIKDLKEYCVVSGKQIPRYRGRRIGQRYIWANFQDTKIENMHSETENRHFLHNALALYSKNTLVAHAFDENLYGKEDRYWINDMANRGFKSIYDPSMQCFHHWTLGGSTWKGIG